MSDGGTNLLAKSSPPSSVSVCDAAGANTRNTAGTLLLCWRDKKNTVLHYVAVITVVLPCAVYTSRNDRGRCELGECRGSGEGGEVKSPPIL